MHYVHVLYMMSYVPMHYTLSTVLVIHSDIYLVQYYALDYQKEWIIIILKNPYYL
jgi:hypothetical protein